MRRTENKKGIMKNDKIILDLCGGSGSWGKPYVEAGYDVKLITLPDFSVLDWYLIGEDIIFKNQTGGYSLVIKIKDIHGILAAPPCTEFSVAKGNRPRDLVKGMEVVEACMKIIWQCRHSGNLKFWALENPRGFLRQFLGNPPFTFEHWQYADQQIKPTDVWGYYSKPTYKVKIKPEGLTVKYGTRINGRGWGNPKAPAEYAHLNLNRAAIRAITPAGFAKAFYNANK